MDFDETANGAPLFVQTVSDHLGKCEDELAMKVATEAFASAVSKKDTKAKCFALHAIAKIQLSVGEFSDAKDVIDKGVSEVEKASDDKLKGALLNTAAKIYKVLGKYQEALQMCQAAVSLFQKAGGKAGEAASVNCLANVHLSNGRRQDGLKFAKQAVEMFKECSEKTGEASARATVVKAYSSMRKFDEALRAANEILGIFEGGDDIEKEAEALFIVADARVAVGEPEEGQEKAQKAVTVLENARMFAKQAAALQKLGELCIAASNPVDGWAYMKEARELYHNTGQKRGEAVLFCQIATANANQGRYEEAVMIAEEGIALCSDEGFKSQLAGLKLCLCSVYQQMEASGFAQEQVGNWKSRVAGKEALAAYQEMGDLVGQQKALNALAGAFLAYGNVSAARANAKEACEICQELGDKAGEGANMLLVSQTKLHENKEEALRLASIGHKLIRESGDAELLKEADQVLDFVKSAASAKKAKKEKESKGPKIADVQSEKSDIYEICDNGKQVTAYWWGFTARTARMRRQ